MKAKELLQKEVNYPMDIGPTEKPIGVVYGVAYTNGAKTTLVGEVPIMGTEDQADRLALELNCLLKMNRFMSVAVKMFAEKPAKPKPKVKKKAKNK